jgi:hypothetical protein
MAQLSSKRIQALLRQGLNASTRTAQGRALEDLVCYVFGKVPGIEIVMRDALNVFATEEVDVAFWNDRSRSGFHFLPNVLLVECKNWSHPVGSQEVSYFGQRLQNHGRDHGILVAANGISGSAQELKRAHYEIAMSLSRGLHILVLTGVELAALHGTNQLIDLVKGKLCELAVSGTVVP